MEVMNIMIEELNKQQSPAVLCLQCTGYMHDRVCLAEDGRLCKHEVYIHVI